MIRLGSTKLPPRSKEKLRARARERLGVPLVRQVGLRDDVFSPDDNGASGNIEEKEAAAFLVSLFGVLLLPAPAVGLLCRDGHKVPWLDGDDDEAPLLGARRYHPLPSCRCRRSGPLSAVSFALAAAEGSDSKLASVSPKRIQEGRRNS